MKLSYYLLSFLLIFAAFNAFSPICQLPKVNGPCKAAFKRFFFNSETSQCEKFIYGGCQGNENNFESLQECKETCESNERFLNENIEKLGLSDFCFYSPEPGPCKAYFVRYYYDYATGNCENFVYGGCGGNENNFDDLETCIKTCS